MQLSTDNTEPAVSDASLLSRMAADDQEAFALLYRRYWESLFITAARALRSSDDAADLVQEVFLSLWNRRQNIVLKGALDAYLHTSVRYQAIAYLKKHITERDYLETLTELSIQHLANSPDLALQLREIQEVIDQTVAAMPPKMQQVYRLSRVEQLTHRQIADQLGISEETAKKHVHHALQLLRAALKPLVAPLVGLLFRQF